MLGLIDCELHVPWSVFQQIGFPHNKGDCGVVDVQFLKVVPIDSEQEKGGLDSSSREIVGRSLSRGY